MLRVRIPGVCASACAYLTSVNLAFAKTFPYHLLFVVARPKRSQTCRKDRKISIFTACLRSSHVVCIPTAANDLR